MSLGEMQVKRKRFKSDWQTIKSISKLNFDEIACICYSSELGYKLPIFVLVTFALANVCMLADLFSLSSLYSIACCNLSSRKIYHSIGHFKNVLWTDVGKKENALLLVKSIRNLALFLIPNVHCPFTAFSHAIGGLFVKFYKTLNRMSIHSSARMSVYEFYTVSCFVIAARF